LSSTQTRSWKVPFSCNQHRPEADVPCSISVSPALHGPLEWYILTEECYSDIFGEFQCFAIWVTHKNTIYENCRYKYYEHIFGHRYAQFVHNQHIAQRTLKRYVKIYFIVSVEEESPRIIMKRIEYGLWIKFAIRMKLGRRMCKLLGDRRWICRRICLMFWRRLWVECAEWIERIAGNLKVTKFAKRSASLCVRNLKHPSVVTLKEDTKIPSCRYRPTETGHFGPSAWEMETLAAIQRVVTSHMIWCDIWYGVIYDMYIIR
jgi:hypothetical protein